MAAVPERLAEIGPIADPRRRRYLFGPVADFLLLGGGSIFVVVPLALFWPSGADTAQLAAWTLFAANLINHPHFAHSYQLFYRDFPKRALGSAFPVGLRIRYVLAGVVVPLVLAGFFALCLYRGSVVLLGYAGNLMVFLVGWHYVKQGYGMLMLDAVLKRSFFNEAQKRWLLWNAYLVWGASWVHFNLLFREKNFWNIRYAMFEFPPFVLNVLLGLVAVSFVGLVLALVHKYREGQAPLVPFNGLVAYVVSLYLWLLVRHPAVLFVVPAFHSLQYLAVVWRHELNRRSSGEQNKEAPRPVRRVVGGFGLFLVTGFLLGYMGFWYIPERLTDAFPAYSSLFGGALFLFLFWIFINIHHFFLDNVMWRKENPDTRRYLFGG